MQLKDLVVFWTILLLKPSLLSQFGNDLEEYPQAPASIANRSTAQPFFSMTLASGVYLFLGVPVLHIFFTGASQFQQDCLPRGL